MDPTNLRQVGEFKKSLASISGNPFARRPGQRGSIRKQQSLVWAPRGRKKLSGRTGLRNDQEINDIEEPERSDTVRPADVSRKRNNTPGKYKLASCQQKLPRKKGKKERPPPREAMIMKSILPTSPSGGKKVKLSRTN